MPVAAATIARIAALVKFLTQNVDVTAGSTNIATTKITTTMAAWIAARRPNRLGTTIAAAVATTRPSTVVIASPDRR